jgi:tetratricopeptide (TPR) repeat protein
MKLKTLFVSLLMAMPMVGFAQEDKSADEYKNDGNAAYRNKDFAGALTAYEKAIELWGEELDAATVYNAAMCAEKTKDLDKAKALYEKSVTLDYKADISTYKITSILGKQKKVEEQRAALEAAVTKYTEGKAAAFIKKDLTKSYRDEAFAAYNAGAKKLAECQSAKPEDYAAIKAEAKKIFSEGTPWIEKALTVSPGDEQCTKIKQSIDEMIAECNK